LLVLSGAITSAIVIGALARFFLPPRWETVLGVGLLFVACAGVKWKWPNNTFLRGVSWRYFTMLALIAESIILLLRTSAFSAIGPFQPRSASACSIACFISSLSGMTGAGGAARKDRRG
jgi:hypothetical protein